MSRDRSGADQGHRGCCPRDNRKEVFANISLWLYGAGMELSSITPDPTALRALSHPVRLRILGLLRVDGPSTASALAARLGLNSGATSYHLRQLAQHGFAVDDAERGNGRDRWWWAAHQSTRTDASAEANPEGREAIDAFSQSVAVVHTEQLQRAVEERPMLPVAVATGLDAERLGAAGDAGARRAADGGARERRQRLGGANRRPRTPSSSSVVLHTYPRPGRSRAERPA